MDNNLQADFSTGPLKHTLLLGLDHQRANTNYKWLYGAAPTSNINKPIYGQPTSASRRLHDAYNDYKQKMRDTGLYAQDQIALDNWRLTLGGRQDWAHTGATFYNKGGATNTSRDKKFSGNAALSYVFENGVAPYVSYAESFQAEAGGAAGAAFEPSTGKQYELGVKYQPVGTDLMLSAAVYDLTRKNIVLTGSDFISRPVGEAQVRGFELEAVGNVTENLKVTAAYTYANSKMTKVANPLDKNRPLPLTPENQASLWADYTWHDGLLDGFGLGFGTRYVGETHNIAIGSMGYVRDKSDGDTGSYTVYDAAVHYDLGRLDNSLNGLNVALNANNVFDKEYISTCDGFYCYYGDRRNVVASVNYKF